MADLNFKTLESLHSIWILKAWEFHSSEASEAAFDNLCAMFQGIPIHFHPIALNLIRSFSRYTIINYEKLLYTAISKLGDIHLNGIGKVVFCPLLNPTDEIRGNAKSGHILPYMIRSGPIQSNKRLLEIKCEFLANSSLDLLSKHLKEKSTLIVLMDDFIGSGDTARNAVYGLEKLLRAEDKIMVMGLVVMTKAVNYLSKYGINVEFGMLERKGIEENDLIIDKIRAYTLVDFLENKLNIKHNQRHGYEKTEALVTMLRTPDNTFPMYWCTSNLDGSAWPALFPRMEL